MESQRLVCPGSRRPSMEPVNSTLTVSGDNATLTVKYCGKRHVIKIHKIDSGTVTCRVDNKAPQTVNFTGIDQFLKRLGKVLDHQMPNDRPNLKLYSKEIYRKLNLSRAQNSEETEEPAQQRPVPREQNPARVERRTNESREFEFSLNGRTHTVKIEKICVDEVRYYLDGTTTGRIKFKDAEELRIKLGEKFDSKFGRGRPNFSRQIDEIAGQLGLKGRQERVENLRAVSVRETILDAKIGTYRISDERPLSNLLVEYQRNPAFRCLSLVQNVFDMIYGVGEARRVGLYDATPLFAANLNFTGKPVKMEAYNPERHQILPRGTIIRLTMHGAGYRSIAISLGNGKIAHLIGDTLHIEKMNKVLSDGWMPGQIITPNSSFSQRSVELVTGNGLSFEKGNSVERIADELRRLLPRLTGKELGVIQEIIYQYNKSKFEKEGRGIGFGMRLTAETPIAVPKEWVGGSDTRTAGGSR